MGRQRTADEYKVLKPVKIHFRSARAITVCERGYKPLSTEAIKQSSNNIWNGQFSGSRNI
jgi:hypothetical protein